MSSNDYKIILTWNNEKSKFTIPINPEKVTVNMQSKNNTVNIEELGELMERGTPNLVTISFDSVFSYSELIVNRNRHYPIWYHNKLQKLFRKQTVVHLIITGMYLDYYCLITDYQSYEQGGDVGSIYYSITFKQYKTVSVRKIGQKTRKRVNTAVKNRTYTVQKGDSLLVIAVVACGDSQKDEAIYKLNKSLIDSIAKKYHKPAKWLKPGTVLLLPD